MAPLPNGQYKKTLLKIHKNPSSTILCKFPQRCFAKVSSLLTTPRASLEGSMTIEAALLLPLILSFLMLMGSIVEMMRFSGRVQLELWNLGNQISMYGYLQDSIGEEEQASDPLGLASMFTEAHIRTRLEHALGEEYMDNAPIEGELHVRVVQNPHEDTVEVVVTYTVSPWMAIAGFPSFQMRNTYYAHLWNGYDLSPSEAPSGALVYVTENGSVYHLERNCTYIDISVNRVDANSLLTLQTAEGISYLPCQICREPLPKEHYYITREGEVYHYDSHCSSISRTVFSIPMEEAGAYRPCGKCAAGGRE